MIKRYADEISRMEHVLEGLGGARAVLSVAIDANGEFLSQPFVDRIKEVTTDVMSEIRNRSEDGSSHGFKKETIWK